MGGGAKLVRSRELLLLVGSKGLGWCQRLLGGGTKLLLWESSLWWSRAIVATLLLVGGRRGWLLLPLAWPPCTLGIMKRLGKI